MADHRAIREARFGPRRYRGQGSGLSERTARRPWEDLSRGRRRAGRRARRLHRRSIKADTQAYYPLDNGYTGDFASLYLEVQELPLGVPAEDEKNPFDGMTRAQAAAVLQKKILADVRAGKPTPMVEGRQRAGDDAQLVERPVTSSGRFGSDAAGQAEIAPSAVDGPREGRAGELIVLDLDRPFLPST